MWNKAKGDFIFFLNHKRKTVTAVDTPLNGKAVPFTALASTDLQKT